ncbi:hypothetical protein I8J29_00120 [Paenibacillus sp. MWE-103]|uniref:Uncharacterized protein n=1 Tax=Paenibacillus artemisiicola TaxID=1172618 RepID=A0ABS3W2S0_9BACL|nr:MULTISPECIES: hypothetical protein [Paenibacillus]MBO7742578.1 hypothetical protein [Paenibacillus artemisiicola]SFI34343.1 hypothetical protein SAMN02799624_00476 [Paenibacillus sp. UNC496MF]
MGRHQVPGLPGKMRGMRDRDRQAENDVAGSTDRNRNQKGHVPNSPSTG